MAADERLTLEELLRRTFGAFRLGDVEFPTLQSRTKGGARLGDINVNDPAAAAQISEFFPQGVPSPVESDDYNMGQAREYLGKLRADFGTPSNVHRAFDPELATTATLPDYVRDFAEGSGGYREQKSAFLQALGALSAQGDPLAGPAVGESIRSFTMPRSPTVENFSKGYTGVPAFSRGVYTPGGSALGGNDVGSVTGNPGTSVGSLGEAALRAGTFFATSPFALLFSSAINPKTKEPASLLDAFSFFTGERSPFRAPNTYFTPENFSDDPNLTSYTGEGDALGALGFAGDAFGGDVSLGADMGSDSLGAGFGGDGGGVGAGVGVGGPFHKGGLITDKNPKTRQDNMKVIAQEGEYVIPRKVVAKLGPEFLDAVVREVMRREAA